MRENEIPGDSTLDRKTIQVPMSKEGINRLHPKKRNGNCVGSTGFAKDLQQIANDSRSLPGSVEDRAWTEAGEFLRAVSCHEFSSRRNIPTANPRGRVANGH